MLPSPCQGYSKKLVDGTLVELWRGSTCLTRIGDLGPPEQIARSRPPPEERRGAVPGGTMAGGIGRCQTLKLGTTTDVCGTSA